MISQEAIEKRAPKKARWAVFYHLNYDGGDGRFIEYYRTKTGMRIGISWNLHVSSWGGEFQIFKLNKKAKVKQ